MKIRIRKVVLVIASTAALLAGTASSCEAGVIPWLFESLFGPPCGYNGYNGCGGYGQYGTARYYSTTPTAPTTYEPSTRTTAAYAQPAYYPPRACLPRLCLPPLPPLFPMLFGCGPYRSPYYGYSPRYRYGYNNCPVTYVTPAAPASSSTGTWSRSQPRTFADGGATETEALRPAETDAGEVIPSNLKKPARLLEKIAAPGDSAAMWRLPRRLVVGAVVPGRGRIARRIHHPASTTVTARRPIVIDLEWVPVRDTRVAGH